MIYRSTSIRSVHITKVENSHVSKKKKSLSIIQLATRQLVLFKIKGFFRCVISVVKFWLQRHSRTQRYTWSGIGNCQMNNQIALFYLHNISDFYEYLHLHEIVGCLYFHCSFVSLCVCVIVCQWTKFQPYRCTDLDTFFAKRLLTALPQTAIEICELWLKVNVTLTQLIFFPLKLSVNFSTIYHSSLLSDQIEILYAVLICPL